MFVVMRRRQTVRLTEDGDWPLVSRNSALLVMFTLLSSSSSSSNSRLWFTLTQPAPLWWQRPLQCLEAGGLSPSHLWPGLQVTALVWVPSPHLAEQGDQGPESQESQESQESAVWRGRSSGRQSWAGRRPAEAGMEFGRQQPEVSQLRSCEAPPEPPEPPWPPGPSGPPLAEKWGGFSLGTAWRGCQTRRRRRRGRWLGLWSLGTLPEGWQWSWLAGGRGLWWSPLWSQSR